MSKRSFNPEQCIAPLNKLKQGLQWKGVPFNKETIIGILKSCGLPTNSNFWRVFRNSGILQEVSRGQFMFTSKDPIYVGTLNTIKTKYKELVRRYNRNKKPEVPESKEEHKDELPENDPLALTQFAIDLLKEQGYQIFAPVGVVYQQL